MRYKNDVWPGRRTRHKIRFLFDGVLKISMISEEVTGSKEKKKFVDDLTVVEIVSRNSPSVLNFIVQDISQYAVTNNMTLNPCKCKEMSVDFLQYNSCVLRLIVLGNAIVERVASFKLTYIAQSFVLL